METAVGSRCHCHMCETEVVASPGEDLELCCAQCGSTCVELIESQAAQQPEARAPQIVGPPQVHVGVICDGCQARDFYGVRYRCLNCADYDLCDRCYAQRETIHPHHHFEEMRTVAPPPLLQSLFGGQDLRHIAARGMGHTIITVMEIPIEEESSNAESGLEDSQVSWWLAGDERLVDAQRIASEDPTWTCPICSEGLEAEGSQGWLVRICTTPLEKSPQQPISGETGELNEARSGASNDGHLYHEACLRQWLLKKNACPVCRRSPVVPNSGMPL